MEKMWTFFLFLFWKSSHITMGIFPVLHLMLKELCQIFKKHHKAWLTAIGLVFYVHRTKEP